MKRIDTAKRRPDPDNPRRLIYDGERTAQEIFSELRRRLESAGYLPDEYFMMNRDWEDGRPWPEDGDISCAVDYGGSEGIYLDVYLKYRDENKKWQTKTFATGKTLGEADDDMDRMYLIASTVTKAFHSDGVHSRFVRVGEPEEPTGATVHLNKDEKKLVAQSLIDTRARLKAEHKPFEAVDRLLRRIVGSITEFVRMVGERPQNIDRHDRAVLAIQDGDTDALIEAVPHIPHVYGNLLEQAAARPGETGRNMTKLLCDAATEIDNDMYLRACKNAVNTNDTDRALMMLSSAESCVPNLKPGFYGDVLLHALSADEKHGGRKTHAAATIAEHCTPEQVRGADPFLLKLAIMHDDRRLINALLDRNISVTDEPAMLIYAAAQKKDVEPAARLIGAGADVNGQNHAALFAAMGSNDHATGMFLLKCGADFEGFSNEVIEHGVKGRKLTENEIGFSTR
ncbi:MAG: ankyrin repeat domain-containing protein [Clostridiales Family XIII bacterium]|jgi:hypothetical protein|nr:ankyrin repeat domain-containing protein [Clostridiales Family XIII bacterium]